MKLDLQDLKKSSDELDTKIKEHFQPFVKPNKLLITDGIVNVVEYYSCPIRIMWVLKEPYDDGNGGGGGWCMKEGLNTARANGLKHDATTTWHPITYVTYGILNDYSKFESMKKISLNPSMNSYLRNIAFINVNKLPAKTTTDNRLLSTFYRKNKDILLEQIATYKPNIVIGGSTLHLFKDDLGITKEEELKYGHFYKDKTLFLNAKHPGQRTKSRAEYVNTIIGRAEEYKSIYS